MTKFESILEGPTIDPMQLPAEPLFHLAFGRITSLHYPGFKARGQGSSLYYFEPRDINGWHVIHDGGVSFWETPGRELSCCVHGCDTGKLDTFRLEEGLKIVKIDAPKTPARSVRAVYCDDPRRTARELVEILLDYCAKGTKPSYWTVN